MVSLLISVGGKALQILLGSNGNLSNRDTVSASLGLWQALKALGTFLQKLFGNQVSAWQRAEPEIIDGALGLGQIAYNEKQAWIRLLEHILPHSLSWLDGHTHRWVDAKFDWQVAAFWKYFRALWDWQTAIRNWRHKFVDPSLVADNDYRRWLKGWPQAQWFRWKDYFEHPGKFGEWAAPPIARPLYDHLRGRSHVVLLDQYTGLFIGATRRLPRPVERAMADWLVAEW